MHPRPPISTRTDNSFPTRLSYDLRVYVPEALIIFTSNLGIYATGPDGERRANVTSDQPFEEVQSRVRTEIENHFKLVLNRPEILNRFGENIIVFDFIRSEVAGTIFDAMVASVLADAADAGRSITIAPEAHAEQIGRAHV